MGEHNHFLEIAIGFFSIGIYSTVEFPNFIANSGKLPVDSIGSFVNMVEMEIDTVEPFVNLSKPIAKAGKFLIEVFNEFRITLLHTLKCTVWPKCVKEEKVTGKFLAQPYRDRRLSLDQLTARS